MKPTPLLVFADDWGRHPSSCQHLVRRLLDRHPVTWVNTIGTRTPKFDLLTMSRGLGKIRQWLRPVTKNLSPQPPSRSAKGEPDFPSPLRGGAGERFSGAPKAELTALNPKMWPWFTRKLDRSLNRRLLLAQLRPVVERMPEAPIAVTTLPIVADVMDDLPVRRWIYYCVDDFSQWPGLDRATMARMERRVVERADTLVAVSKNLQARLHDMGRHSHLLPHGVDLDFWRSKQASTTLFDGVSRPLIVFWGVIDQRMNAQILAYLSHALPEGTIVFVGPEQQPNPALQRLPRILRTGALPYEQLPAIAQEAAVLIMPYADVPVTRSMQPLKLKEYLATGKPVVVSDLPATREWADALDIAHSPEQFAELVKRRIQTGVPQAQQVARQRLATRSWAARAQAFESLIFAHDPVLVDTN